jgi:hypothetical protein
MPVSGESVQGRLPIGPQVINLPNTAAELQPKVEEAGKPGQHRLAIGAQLIKLPHADTDEPLHRGFGRLSSSVW